MITQNYKIDMMPGAVPLRVKVSQYDVGVRQLVFQLYNGATACTSNNFDLSAQIVGTKQDQKGFAYEASVDSSALGIWVTIDITEQMTACAGDVVCEIRMYNNSSRISTANFILDVEPAALGADTDISETEIPAIIDAARGYAEDAEEAAAHMSAGAAIGNSTSVISGVVDTNIDLGKNPSNGDRILLYVETQIDDPVSLKTYNDGVAITTSLGSSGPESLAGLCLLEYTEDPTDHWALLWMDEGGGGGIGDAYAGLGVGKMVSATNDVVNTDIDLHRAPMAGDRLLLYCSDAVASPASITTYNNGTAVTTAWGGIAQFGLVAGLNIVRCINFLDLGLRWERVQSITYTAGTGISISGSTISNSAPQNGDNVAYSAVSSVKSGDLGFFNGKADYFMIDFRTDAEPYDGKYTLKLSLGSYFKYAVLKDRDGNLYAENFIAGNLLQCVKTSSGSGSEDDPVVVTVLSVGDTNNYSRLTNKPSINGVTLQGNKTTSDLNLPTYTAGTGIDITNNAIFNTMRGACAGYISSISAGTASTQITLATNETFKAGELIVLRSDAYGTAQTLKIQYGSESSQRYNYNLKDLYGLAKTVTLKENSVLVCMLDATGYNAIVLAVLAEDFYLEEQVTLSTSQSTTVVFNNSFIRADSVIDVTVSEWGIFPEDVTITAGATGACTVVLPKVSTAQTVTVGIFVK